LLFGFIALLPLAAQASTGQVQVAALDQLERAIFASCNLLPPDPDPCVPSFSCSRVFNSCTYHHQKANGMCVYICAYTETCTDVECGTGSTTSTGTQRYRIGPFVPGACPAGSPSIAEEGEPD
jgi:hypothetical protein